MNERGRERERERERERLIDAPLRDAEGLSQCQVTSEQLGLRETVVPELARVYSARPFSCTMGEADADGWIDADPTIRNLGPAQERKADSGEYHRRIFAAFSD